MSELDERGRVLFGSFTILYPPAVSVRLAAQVVEAERRRQLVDELEAWKAELEDEAWTHEEAA